jgi:cell division protein ZapA
MSAESIPVTIKIMDKEFQVACPAEEQAALEESAALLNQHMKQVKDSGKVFGTDRIAIIAALNLTHELLQHKDESRSFGKTFSERITAMQNKVEAALQDTQQMEF